MTKHKRIWVIICAALVVCLIAAGCMNTDQPGTTTGDGVHSEVTASDEAQLRQLLAQEGQLVIRVTADMQVREGFAVNGTKTLCGEAKLTMALGAELGQALLSVSENSTLTLDGPVLDCNYNCDGINVAQNAVFNCKSGTVKNAGAYGILTYGDVQIEDILITDCEFVSICAQTGSKVYIRGGSVKNSQSNDVYIVPGAYVNISGDTVMEGAQEHAMINYGTLEINGGKFGNVNNYLCDNYGELTVAYLGEKKDGMVEFYGARNSIFLIRGGSSASFEDVYIHDTKRQGIASLGGDTTIRNCTFENTGNHSIDIQSGKAVVENVTVISSKGSGLEASNGSTVQVTNFTVDGCEKIGIASRGAAVTVKNVKISNTGKYGITCGDTQTGQGVLVVEGAVLSGTANHGVYVYDAGEAELKDIRISDGAARGMYIAATATCKVSGESTIQRMKKGGVEVRGTLELENVNIFENNTQNSGAGVYAADGGVVTINGGAIYDNVSALRGAGICVSDATVTLNGTKVYNNRAANHGGGIYAQKAATVNLNSGEVTKNHSEENGDGIFILSAETKVTVGEEFYLGGNDVKVDHVDAVLYISGNGLKKHSASDPLLLTPNHNAPVGTAVAVCTNENVAKSIAEVVASGDGSYYVSRDGKRFTIGYTTANMDLTGADTVYVSNFVQLEEAVLGTTAKRIIVLKADIQMERRIRLPGGVTIRITDDGTKRTLTRADGFTDSFFVTHYGTGLYLTGTKAGNLVLDGGYQANADAGKLQPLVRVAGSTELDHVVMRNNGSLTKENDVRGALIRQICGDLKIYDSALSGGHAYAGGAVMIDQGKAYLGGCVLSGNASSIGGGAIRAAGGSVLKIEACVLSDNHAGTTGGAIVVLDKASVTASNTTFTGNTAETYGGAISAQDQGTVVKLVGTSEAAVFESNSAVTSGAVYAVKSVQLEISGYSFLRNSASNGRAGAVCILDNSVATVTDTVFYQNTATASGGAFVADGSKAKLVNCQFGKQDAGNTAGDKAGALLVTGGSTVTLTTTGEKQNSVSFNTAKNVGGAVYIEKNSTLIVENTVFEANKGSSGGAIYIVDQGKAVSTNNRFLKNSAISGDTYGNGGAVYAAGKFTETGSSYDGNTAKNGGAVIVMGTGVATMDAATADAVLQNNTANLEGDAIFVNAGGDLTVNGYTLGDAGNSIFVKGSLTFTELTNAQIVQGDKNAVLTVGSAAGTKVQVKPLKYEKGSLVLAGAANADISGLTVTPTDDGKSWLIDEAGELTYAVASITVGETVHYFNTLNDAVAYGNNAGEAVTIVVLHDTKILKKITVTGDITIVNNGSDRTVTRGFVGGDMFQVDGKLTLGNTGAGKLIINGASTNVINYRIVTVNADASFVLAKNAVLRNAKSGVDGAAVYTQSVQTVINGTIENNVSSKTGAGLHVAENAKATIDGASFIGNRSAGTGGAVYISANAAVVSKDAAFQNNQASYVSNNETKYSNGGAVYVAGTFEDANSSYTGNVGKNGGAVHVASGSTVLNGVSFSGESEQKITVVSGLTFKGLTNAHIVQMNANAAFTVSGAAGTNVQITPLAYTAGSLKLTKGEGVEDADFAAACKAISVIQNNDGNFWNIDEAGELTYAVASITVGETVHYFNTLNDAVAYGNNAGEAVTIVVLHDTKILKKITVTGDITIVNNGSDRTVTRGFVGGDMFQVDGELTLGNTGAGKLIINGASTNVINYRIVTVNADASFVLAKNAVLQNAKAQVAGAAIYTESKNTILYGTIQNNVSGTAGAGLDVAAGAKVTIDGASFIGNRSAGVAGAIRVNEGASVICQNALFENNKALSGTSTYANGGAVYVAGTFEDTNSSYTGNVGKNGGAIFLGASTANVTLTGTDTTKAVFDGNQATGAKNSRGGAIFVNGGKISVTGYTFTGNTSTGTDANTGSGAVHVVNGSATLKDVTFTGDTVQKIYVQKSLTFGNLTNAHIVQMNANAAFTVSGAVGTNVQITPLAYTAGSLKLTKAANAAGVDFGALAVMQTTDGNYWFINESGELAIAVASITSGTATSYFDTFGSALTAAQELGAAEVVVMEDVTVSETITVDAGKSLTLLNASGETITLTRDAAFKGDLFTVNGTLILGGERDGALVIDGAPGGDTTAAAITGRTVTVNSGASFTLGKNATLQNANSTNAGAAIYTASANTNVYGTVDSNTVTGTTIGGAGMYLVSGAKANIEGATFSNNRCVASNNKAGAGAALNIQSGAEVICQNATFTNNTVPTTKNGGAVYCVGVFKDTNSSYTGNTAKNGGAIFLGANTANVTLTGTDPNKAVFDSNTATGATTSKGGALYNNGGTLVVTGYTFTNNTCQASIASPTDLKNAQIWSAQGTTTLNNVTQ